MKGIIVNFRQGRTTQKNNHMIVQADGVDKKDKAAKLVGKVVVWKSPKGKEIPGKVASAHGNKGALRVIFDKGLPGQSVGTAVELK
ncbi:50S ribosomal protein L35ae [Candidatus Woesearchaeota archaeon]|nr:50S ribosomal protein L35ae [Candidatus Woesearchaeota archaeon]